MTKSKKFIKIFAVLLCCTFFVMFVICITYSKYLKKLQTTSITKIAKPEVSLNKAENINCDFLNSNKLVYDFFIKNFEDENYNEVVMKYKIMFELSQCDAPVIIELYKVQNGDEIKMELENNITVEEEEISLEAEENKYRVYVYYNVDSQKVLESNFNINLKVKFWQKEVLNS